jgi:hypothetical protein
MGIGTDLRGVGATGVLALTPPQNKESNPVRLAGGKTFYRATLAKITETVSCFSVGPAEASGRICIQDK